MSHNRLMPHGPESYGIEANAGVDLKVNGQHLMVIPRSHADALDPAPPPIEFPRLPAQLVERKVRLLRHLWYQKRRCIWCLYIDTPSSTWHAYLPPQIAYSDGIRADLAFSKVAVPRPELRLAGTIQSSPLLHPEELMTQLPVCDGVHLFFHPAESWLILNAFLTIQSRPVAVMPHQVIADPDDPQLQSLAQRLWVVNGQ